MIANVAAGVGRVLHPEGLRLAAVGLRFGETAQLSSGRPVQAGHGWLVENFPLNQIPPMRLRDGLVVDVGANVGDFTAAVFTLDPQGMSHRAGTRPQPPQPANLAPRTRDGRLV